MEDRGSRFSIHHLRS